MGVILYTLLFLYATVADVMSDIQVIEPDLSKVERPCSLDDLQCLRREFKNRGFCNRKTPQNPDDPFTPVENIYYMPSVNVTIYTENVVYEQLGDGQVLEYYINTDTGKAVFAVHYDEIKVSEVAKMHLHRPAKEDLVIVAPDTSETYPDVTTTTIISGLKKASTSRRESHSRLGAVPEFSFGNSLPPLFNSEALGVFVGLVVNVYAAAQELYLVKSNTFGNFYIDNVICNSNYNPNNNN